MPLIPLIDQQRRMVEVGRIRLGKKVVGTRADGSEYTRPAKLDKFRLTSRDKNRLDAAAALYGGEVAAWEGQWELYTQADAFPIAVVPGQALNVSYEEWGQKTIGGKKTPVICLRRCDGEFEAKSDGPCLCARQEDMTCKPTARLSVVLTDVPGLGVWRLESHGWNALTELQGTVELLEMLVAAGRPVRARLRVDRRETPTEKGTFKYPVAVIDIDHTMGQVLDSLGHGAGAPALEQGTPAVGGGFTPVPELPAAPAASIGDQMSAVDAPAAPSTRKNQQQPIAPTGLAPRRADQVAGAVVPAPAPSDGEREGSEAVAAVSDPSPPSEDDGPVMPLPQRIAMWCNDAGLDDDGRHRFLAACSNGEYSSAKDVPPGDVAGIRSKLDEIKRGGLVLGVQDGKPVLMWAARDTKPEPAAVAPTDAQQSIELIDADYWAQRIAPIRGVGQTSLLRAARTLAEDLGVAVPSGVDEITEPALVTAVQDWLESKAGE